MKVSLQLSLIGLLRTSLTSALNEQKLKFRNNFLLFFFFKTLKIRCMKEINLDLARHNVCLFRKQAENPGSKLYIRNDKFYLIDLKGQNFLTYVQNIFIKMFFCFFNHDSAAIKSLYGRSKKCIPLPPQNIDIDLIQTRFLTIRNTVENLTEIYKKSPGRLDARRITAKSIINFQKSIDAQIPKMTNINLRSILQALKDDCSLLIESFYKNIYILCETGDVSDVQNQRGLQSIVTTLPSDLKRQITNILDERISSLSSRRPTDITEVKSSETTPPSSVANILRKSPDYYDRQIFLNLGSGTSAAGIDRKRQSNGGSPSISIDLKIENPSLDQLRLLTHRSRIYIIGHCHPNSQSITSDLGKSQTAEDYAKMIANNAPHLTNRDREGRMLKIRIYACYAASGTNSFAKQLTEALFRKDILTEVTATAGLVPRWDGQGIFHKKTSDPKYSFTQNGGRKLV
jgi:hypothetical protein